MSREEKEGSMGEKTSSSRKTILYAALILLGLVVLVTNVSWGIPVKVFIIIIGTLLVLLALGFMWIVVKVIVKTIYSKVRQGIQSNQGARAKGL
jgi:uncharacterized membrane protein YqjE